MIYILNEKAVVTQQSIYNIVYVQKQQCLSLKQSKRHRKKKTLE